MKIHEINIKNFKGFENETFALNPHFTVIIGKNATGKTSILEAAESFFIDKQGIRHHLEYRQLSDGYRNLIGIAADMAYRCVQLNPHLGEKAITDTKGIVLIDEIDLHLHPEWQRHVVADLKRVFPNIQFVATTHSPFIVQSLGADEVIDLDRKQDIAPSLFSLNEIAENFMGVDSVDSLNIQIFSVARHFTTQPQTADSLDFDIKPLGTISRHFLAHNISTFSEATAFVRQLAYRRNENKTDLATVFIENCGTCSTKHALLKLLADENNYSELKLIMGIFRMNASNTPKISATLKQYKLDYIPEAHNYLKYKNRILDFTSETSKPADFEKELIEEIEIRADQITAFKVDYHKKHLHDWLKTQKTLSLTLDELWKIREQCIADLSAS